MNITQGAVSPGDDQAWLKHSKGIDSVWGVYETSFTEKTLQIRILILHELYSAIQ